MFGIVIVTHCNLGQALLECCEHIVGPVQAAKAVAIDANDNHDAAMQRIQQAVAELGEVDGVLVLTDMFGGTPSNVALTLLDPARLEVISGVSMPMLLHALTDRARRSSLAELARSTAASGRKNVVIAGALLDDPAADDD